MATIIDDVIIAGEKCQNCKYGYINEIDKANIFAVCNKKERTYRWGQCIPCEDFMKGENHEVY